MTRARSNRLESRRLGIALASLSLLFAVSLEAVAHRPGIAPWIGLVDGLALGTTLGATGLVRSYDDAWDEFFESTTLCWLLGVFALFVYWFRRESPSPFFLIQCAAGTFGYVMLALVPPLTWLGVDLLLYVGTFVGWFFSGLFRSGYS